MFDKKDLVLRDFNIRLFHYCAYNKLALYVESDIALPLCVFYHSKHVMCCRKLLEQNVSVKLVIGFLDLNVKT